MRQFRFVEVGSAGERLDFVWDLPDGTGPAPLVAMAHGFKGFADWGFFPWLAEQLVSRGVATLRVDFSHNGTGRDRETGQFTRLDLFEQDRMSYRLADFRQAIEATRREEPRVKDAPLILLGHSLGGALTVLSATSLGAAGIITLASVDQLQFSEQQAEILRRDGVLPVMNQRTGQWMPVGRVALDDLEEHQYDLEQAARGFLGPWLLLHGAADQTVPVQASERLAGLAPKSTLRVLPGADHGFGTRSPFESPSEHLLLVSQVVGDWLAAFRSP